MKKKRCQHNIIEKEKSATQWHALKSSYTLVSKHFARCFED